MFYFIWDTVESTYCIKTKLNGIETIIYMQLLHWYSVQKNHFIFSFIWNNENILKLVWSQDLKPDNIGFTSDGRLKIFDFGLVAIVTRRASLSVEAYEMTGKTGSPRYMAPEVTAVLMCMYVQYVCTVCTAYLLQIWIWMYWISVSIQREGGSYYNLIVFF